MVPGLFLSRTECGRTSSKKLTVTEKRLRRASEKKSQLLWPAAPQPAQLLLPAYMNVAFEDETASAM